jgi:hypothetical protein
MSSVRYSQLGEFLMPSDPNICPKTRLRCGTPEVCWLMFCAKSGGLRGGERVRPIRERELTKAERYALAMSEREG